MSDLPPARAHEQIPSGELGVFHAMRVLSGTAALESLGEDSRLWFYTFFYEMMAASAWPRHEWPDVVATAIQEVRRHGGVG